MSQSAPNRLAAGFLLQRRSLMIGFGAAFVAGACAPEAKQAEGNWGVSGTKPDAINHDAWDKLLGTYAIARNDGVNRIDYKGLKTNSIAELKAYVTALESVKITDYPRDEQFAYWVNLYNAATVQVIIANYPLDSIKDIGLLGQGP